MRGAVAENAEELANAGAEERITGLGRRNKWAGMTLEQKSAEMSRPLPKKSGVFCFPLEP